MKFLVDDIGIFPHSKLKFLVDIVWIRYQLEYINWSKAINIFTNVLTKEKKYKLEICIYEKFLESILSMWKLQVNILGSMRFRLNTFRYFKFEILLNNSLILNYKEKESEINKCTK